MAGTGIEPVYAVYEAAVEPFHLNPQSRIMGLNREPTDYKSVALPLPCAVRETLASAVRARLHVAPVQQIVGVTGFEPTTS